jgi:hypothetical protein
MAIGTPGRFPVMLPKRTVFSSCSPQASGRYIGQPNKIIAV